MTRFKTCINPQLRERATSNTLEYTFPDEHKCPPTSTYIYLNLYVHVINCFQKIRTIVYILLSHGCFFTSCVLSIFSHCKYFSTVQFLEAVQNPINPYFWIVRLFPVFDMINDVTCPYQYYFKSRHKDVNQWCQVKEGHCYLPHILFFLKH